MTTYRKYGTTEVGSIVTIDADDIAVTPYGDISSTTLQGSLEELNDEKVAKAGDTMTGDLTVPNIITAGNVDGRDVSVDGTKLDGIEALADVTDTTNVTAAGALMDSEVDADIKTLVLPANTTISTFGATLIDDIDAATARATIGAASSGANSDITSITGLTTDLTIAQGGTGQSTAQAAIDALSQVSAATNEYVLTKDTASGNAVFKAAVAGSTATTTSEGVVELATDAEVTTGTDTSRVPPVSAMGSHQGMCKAWVSFNGVGTVAVNDSYNVSSITDNGVGDYTINFTNAMPSVNYTPTGSVWNTGDGGSTSLSGSTRGAAGLHVRGDVVLTTSALRIESLYGSSGSGDGAKSDFSGVYVAVFGD